MKTISLLLLTESVIAASLAHSLPRIDWVDCQNNVPTVLSQIVPNNTFSTSSLPSTLHCGHTDVPVDYASTTGDGEKITLGLAMHRPKDPKGLLF